ncbi:MAG TPA: efflux RND transporter periplasmic adaptor subunit [Candidatus Didemnitutus sp.]|nr:efflux RND transporter periplasmic adaptor subunit [Candidatus Didemnitutus sp.]
MKTILLRRLGLCALVLAFDPFARAADDAIVGVVPVVREDLARSLTVQAEFRPYQEIDVHAKVAGYLQDIRVDIGDRVEAGALIATLEVPELKDDLRRAAAAVERAEASYRNAHLESDRLVSVNKTQPNLVAQQEIDLAAEKDAEAAAALAEAKAELEKYRTMDSYARITAPFEGVVTRRFADPGALIQAGTSSSTQAMPLVRLSQVDRLRLEIPISVTYAGAVRDGDPVEIQLDGGRRIDGRIARSSRRISVDTRAMMAEVDVSNTDLSLIPGMYATAVLKVDRRQRALVVPVEAVSGAAHPTVYVVTAAGLLEERPVKLGLETPARYEVLEGLSEGDRVMIGNRSQVHVGERVIAKLLTGAAAS